MTRKLDLFFSTESGTLALNSVCVEHPALCDEHGEPQTVCRNDSPTDLTGASGMNSVVLVFVEYALHNARQRQESIDQCPLLELFGPKGTLAASVHAILQKEGHWQPCFGYVKHRARPEYLIRHAIETKKHKKTNFVVRLKRDSDSYPFIGPQEIHVNLDGKPLLGKMAALEKLRDQLVPRSRTIWKRRESPAPTLTSSETPAHTRLDATVGITAVANAIGLQEVRIPANPARPLPAIKSLSGAMVASPATIAEAISSGYITITANFEVPKEKFTGEMMQDFLRLCAKLTAQTGAIPVLIRCGSVRITVAVPPALKRALSDPALTQTWKTEIDRLHISDVDFESASFLASIHELSIDLAGTTSGAFARPLTSQMQESTIPEHPQVETRTPGFSEIPLLTKTLRSHSPVEIVSTPRSGKHQETWPDMQTRPVIKRKRAHVAKSHRTKSIISDHAVAGFVLICDIVCFSQMRQPDQLKAIARLWEFVPNHPLVSARYDASINGTGDGVLITWSQRRHTIGHAQLLEFAEALISHMRGTHPKAIELRIGIHIGQFLKLKPFPRFAGQLAGPGLNTCAAVCRLADANHIVVSEAFVRHWTEAGGWPETSFYPREDPITVFVQDNEPLGVRVYVKDQFTGSIPNKLLKLLRTEQAIYKSLQDVEVALLTALLEAAPISSVSMIPAPVATLQELANRLVPRVTIFSPLYNEKGFRELHQTEYRVSSQPMLNRRGVTSFAIGNTRNKGPIASAFLMDNVQVVHQLPPSSPTHPNATYIAEVSHWGINELQLRKMSRHPRTVLAFPFGLMPVPDPIRGLQHSEPDGVIVVDLDDPLQAYNSEHLQVIANKLRQLFNNTFSALWSLRTS